MASAVQPEKALSPISVAPLKLTDVRLVQSEKQEPSTVANPSGKVTAVSFVELNAALPR